MAPPIIHRVQFAVDCELLEHIAAAHETATPREPAQLFEDRYEA